MIVRVPPYFQIQITGKPYEQRMFLALLSNRNEVQFGFVCLRRASLSLSVMGEEWVKAESEEGAETLTLLRKSSLSGIDAE